MANKFNRLLLGKIESTKGTDAVPVPTTDAIRYKTMDLVINSETLTREVIKTTMGNLPHSITKQTFELTVEFEAKGSGTAGTAPEASPIYQCCGRDEVIVASTSVSYPPLTNGIVSSTFYVYKDGLLFKLLGAQGTLSQKYEVGQIITYTAKISAPYVAPTAVAVPTNAVYQATQPIVFDSADSVSDGGAIKVGNLDIDDGADIAEHFIIGEHSFDYANRDPSLKLTRDSVNTTAEWTALTALTDVAFTITANSGNPGNILTVTAPVARRRDIKYGERSNRDTLDVEYGLFESSGDDQDTIIYT